MLQLNRLAGLRGDRCLFKNLSAMVNSSELLLVKGQNGAGKTSLLRLIGGLATPEKGEILWNGESITDIRPEYFDSVVYVGHDNGISLDLTVRENLEFQQALKGLPLIRSIPEVLDHLGVARYLNAPCRLLSAGQKRRVALARLAMSEVKLILLDEPFASLDEPALQMVTVLIHQHLKRGGLGVITSHHTIDWQDSSVAEIQLETFA